MGGSSSYQGSTSTDSQYEETARLELAEREDNLDRVWDLGLFSHHTRHRVGRLIRKCARVLVRPGVDVVTQGKANLHFYVIMRGEARVEQDGVRAHAQQHM